MLKQLLWHQITQHGKRNIKKLQHGKKTLLTPLQVLSSISISELKKVQGRAEKGMWEAESPELTGQSKNKSKVCIAYEEEGGEAVKKGFNWV